MSKEIIGRAQIKIDGKYQSWDSITLEEQRKIGIKLNDKSLRSVGYKPVNDKTI